MGGITITLPTNIETSISLKFHFTLNIIDVNVATCNILDICLMQCDIMSGFQFWRLMAFWHFTFLIPTVGSSILLGFDGQMSVWRHYGVCGHFVWCCDGNKLRSIPQNSALTNISGGD